MIKNFFFQLACFGLIFIRSLSLVSLHFFLSLCHLLFSVALEQNVTTSQESLLIFYVATLDLVVFLISRDKKFFFSVSMFWLNFYQIAFIGKFAFFSLTMSPSFLRSFRAECNNEPGIFTNILRRNSWNGKKWNYMRIKANI